MKSVLALTIAVMFMAAGSAQAHNPTACFHENGVKIEFPEHDCMFLDEPMPGAELQRHFPDQRIIAILRPEPIGDGVLTPWNERKTHWTGNATPVAWDSGITHGPGHDNDDNRTSSRSSDSRTEPQPSEPPSRDNDRDNGGNDGGNDGGDNANDCDGTE